MAERSFAHVISFAATLGNHGIRGTRQHDGSVEVLIFQYAGRFISQKIVCRDIHVERYTPLLVGDLTILRRGEERGGVDDDVQTAISGDQIAQTLSYHLAPANVHSHRQTSFLTSDVLGFFGHFLCRLVIAVSDYDMRSALRRQQDSLSANPAAAADNQNYMTAPFFFRRLAANLRFLKLPVFNPKCLG